jgi:predicted dinucleotide-utilizing enzyme
MSAFPATLPSLPADPTALSNIHQVLVRGRLGSVPNPVHWQSIAGSLKASLLTNIAGSGTGTRATLSFLRHLYARRL